MSAWIVYSKDGTTERCRLKKLEYSGSFMNERTVTATFECESEVAFDVFDYIEYRGEKFELEAIPSVKKTSSHNYEYELRFVSLKYELERCEMRDIVPNDNGIVYPTPLTFSFTGDVAYLAERIQANLDALYGTGVWSIVVAEGVTSEDKNITISQQNCWNALSLVNTTYELDFTVKGRVVTIGGNKQSVSHIFQYGKGNGLYEIERSADTETGIVTKLRAYGGTKNLDYSYPKKPEWSDSILDTSFVLSPLRLMLPSFKKDGKTDYIMADDSLVAKYGIREASVIYEDIYPSITGATNSKGEAIDEIKAVDDIDDSKSTFVIHLHDLGFDLEENLTTANAQVSMKTGAMQGYTFNIADNGIERLDDGSYKLTLGRITASSSDTDNFDIPNSKWNMKAGDKFVFLNILMPQEYIRSAENRLLERAKEYLAEYAKTNFSYNVGLHDKFLKQNQTVYNELIEGSKLSVYDEELGISEDVTIQSISITENMEDNILPQVKVTLNNKPSASTLDRIQGQIKELSENASNSFSSQSELLQQYRRKLDKPFFDRLFVAVGTNGKELASTDTTSPIAYIKAKYSFVTVGGVTMYAQDGSVDIPSIAEGLPFDGRTIWFNPKTNQIEVIGGTGGGEGVSNFWDLSGIPLWITNTKPTYSYTEIQGTPDLSKYALASDIPSLSGYATEQWVLGRGYALSSDLSALTTKVNDFLEGSDTDNIINKWKELESFLNGLSQSDNLATILGAKADKTYVDSTFVTIAGTEDVTGVHNFVNGLMVGGIKLFKSQDDVVYLDGNLVVRGGVTMYALDKVTVDSIIENLPIASTSSKGIASFDVSYFTVDANGKVSIIPDSVGLNDVELDAYLTQYKYATHDWVTSQGYLKAHQTIHSLTIKRNGTELGVYTPNSSAKDVDIIVPTKVSDLDNDSKFINGITSTMVTDALGYTPYNAASFTKANIKSTLGISDWALATSKPSYKTSEVTEETNLYFTNARAVSALKSITDGLATDIATKWTQDDSKITNWDTAFGWGDHSKQDYTTNTYVNDTFVTIGGDTEQTITGPKNFIGGFKVNGSPIYYDTEKKYWKLEGDLLVTGGVTMYGNDSEFVSSTIMDAILYDDTTLGINAQGQLYVKGGTGGGTVSGDYLPLSGGVMTGWIGLPKGTAIYDGNTNTLFGFNTSGDDLLVGHNLHNLTIRSYDTTIQTRGDSLRHYNINTGVTSTILDSDNYSSYALPLSGGTLTGTLAIINEDVALCLYRQQNNATPYIRFAKNETTQYGELGVYNDGRLVFWPLVSSQGGYGQWNTVWHSGNDGSGSGLDADLLDGVQLMGASGGVGIMQALPRGYTTANQFFGNGNIVIFDHAPTDVTGWGAHSTVLSLGNRESRNHQIIFSIYGGSPMPRYRRNVDGVWSEVRTFAFLDDNVASATRIQAYTHDSGDKVLLSGTRSDNTYERCIYDNGWGLMLKRSITNTNGYIATLDDNVASSTKSTYSRYIGNVWRDGTTWYDTEYPIYFQWGGADGNSLYIKCGNYPIISTAATRLETVRTIWGQSFDGSGNVDGALATSHDNFFISADSGNTQLLGYSTASKYYSLGYSAGLKGIPTHIYGGDVRLYSGTTETIRVTGNNVGIGTPSPNFKLHVYGNICSYASNANVGFTANTDSGSYTYGVLNSGVGYILGGKRLFLGAEDTWMMTLCKTGLYIGGQASTTSAKLHVNGGILATSGVTMYSDIRKKTKLKDVVLSLQQVAEAPLIEHYYNSDQNKTTHVGSIAQYWAEMNDWFCKKDNEGFYTMEIQNAALASAISVARELVKFETETDKRIRLLEEENKRLKEEVEQLKWNIA